MSKTVLDMFGASNIDDFITTLAEAGMSASTDWEITFTEDIEIKYDKYGSEMFLTDNQLEHLQRIAEK